VIKIQLKFGHLFPMFLSLISLHSEFILGCCTTSKQFDVTGR